MNKNIFVAFTLMIISVLCIGAIAAADVNGTDVEIPQMDAVSIDDNVDAVSVDDVDADVVDNTYFDKLGDDSCNVISDDGANCSAVFNEISDFSSLVSAENGSGLKPFGKAEFPEMHPIVEESPCHMWIEDYSVEEKTILNSTVREIEVIVRVKHNFGFGMMNQKVHCDVYYGVDHDDNYVKVTFPNKDVSIEKYTNWFGYAKFTFIQNSGKMAIVSLSFGDENLAILL